MRLIDRMCPAHVEACLIRWTPAGDCQLCQQQSHGLPDPEILPDLTPDQHDRLNAIHEAGHAVVALGLGMPIVSVEIWRDGEGGRRPDGGRTEFEDDWDALQMDRFIMVWAGQAATDRWLTELGLGTDANRLDLRHVARHDAAQFDAAVAAEGLAFMPNAGVAQARELVDVRWAQITAVADALVVRRRLSADEVHELLETDRT